MSQDAHQGSPFLLEDTITVPQNVVFRTFPAETVVLNLQTGKYHGLNPTAGRMLEVLAESTSVGAAISALAAEYDRPAAGVEQDVQDLCRSLLDRGLIEAESQAAG